MPLNDVNDLMKHLQDAVSSGIITDDSIEQMMFEMRRRDKIKPYLDRIFQGSDGMWYVHYNGLIN